MTAILSQTDFSRSDIPAKKKCGGARTPKCGFRKSSGCYVAPKRRPPVIEEDYEEEKPAPYTPPPITLPAVSTHTITDLMVGLEDDPKGQQDAETYIRQYISFHARQTERARHD